jgi:hypothetical protein
MRTNTLWQASALAALLVVTASSVAQPPGRRAFPGPIGRGGPGAALERTLDEFNLPEAKKATATAAVQRYQDDGRRLRELADAQLMLQLKEVLSPEEFKQLRLATDRFQAGPLGGRGGRGGRLGVDAIVERILSFDKNNDGKVSKEELPERMQNLIEKGDTNKDGVLDKDEIRKLAADLARQEPARGGRGGRGPRGGPPPGPGAGLPPPVLERAVADLKLSDAKKETVTTAIKASREDLRKLTQLARAELLLKMDEVLSEEEYKKFKAALDRQPTFADPPPGGRRGPPR